MRKFLIALFSFAGVMHFIRPANFDKLVPSQLPFSPRAWTYGSGVAELATASLLTFNRTQRLGGLATVGLMLGVWPGNFKMAYDWRQKSWPWQLISLGRLPIQIPLIRAGWRLWRQ